ncbi:hypothetical protein BGZ57DRAFT_631219 [Hyaloscypha finlandica]|nr:hypothetical protein BGZ57DRAFT_631219 [Hyaloscypha finlandica]
MLDSGAGHWETEADITLHCVVSINIPREDLRESTSVLRRRHLDPSVQNSVRKYDNTTVNNDHPSKLAQTPPTINNDQAPLRPEEGSSSSPHKPLQTSRSHSSQPHRLVSVATRARSKRFNAESRETKRKDRRPKSCECIVTVGEVMNSGIYKCLHPLLLCQQILARKDIATRHLIYQPEATHQTCPPTPAMSLFFSHQTCVMHYPFP